MDKGFGEELLQERQFSEDVRPFSEPPDAEN